MSSNEIDRLRVEAMEIRMDMDKARNELAKAREQEQQKRLETRNLPPMSQMTRIQKRYFLEPWWTAGWVSFWMACVPCFVLGIFTPWHVQWCMLGLLFLLTGGAFATAKLTVADWNQRTESIIAGSGVNSRGHHVSCRCPRCY